MATPGKFVIWAAPMAFWITRQAGDVISLRGQSAPLQFGDELRLGEVKLGITFHTAVAVTEQFNPSRSTIARRSYLRRASQR